jgi:hypothetical protein
MKKIRQISIWICSIAAFQSEYFVKSRSFCYLLFAFHAPIRMQERSAEYFMSSKIFSNIFSIRYKCIFYCAKGEYDILNKGLINKN